MNLPNFFSISYKFFRKSCFIRRHTIAQKNFGWTYADCRISGEKGFASRLNNSLDWWGKAHFFYAYAKEVLLRLFRWFFFFAVPLSRKRKAVYDRLSINGASRHPQQANREEWFYLPAPTRPAGQIKPYFLAGGLPGFTLPDMFFSFDGDSIFHGFPFWSFPAKSASTSVYLHFRAFQWAASGSHFRAGCKGNSGIVRESKVKPPVFWENLQPFG